MKKRMLMMFFRPPFPIDGGDKIRMRQMYDMLNKHFHLDILYLYSKKEDANFPYETFQYVDKVYSFRILKAHSYIQTLIGLLFNDLPLQVNYFRKKSVKNWINNNINNYEYVFCGTIRMTNYVKNYSIIKILDYVDAISLNYQIAHKVQKMGIWKLIYKIDKERTLKYELAMISTFQKKIIISEVDRDYLYERMSNKGHMEVIENFVSVKEIDCNIEEDNYILFVGKMNTKPNENAVINFCEKVFVNLANYDKSLKFYIVGACPSKRVRALAKTYKNVIVTGFVKDLESYFLKSKIVVAPMISGAGLQNKIIQAMTLGKCVITTSIGAEGLHNINKEDELIVEDDFFKLENKIKYLLHNEEKRKSIGVKGKDYVRSQFNIERIEKKLWDYLKYGRN